MNNPIHKIKRWVTYADGQKPHWTPDTVQGWLATGVKDKNGVEIYEGHIVRRWIFKDEVKSVVAYACGVFDLIEVNERYTRPLRDFYSDELEIIGHIVEGKS